MIPKLVSGGQTGVDRAALDFARQRHRPHGGWCPRGRLAEDGIISDVYALRETPADDPAQRTEWNVRDSDGTVVFSLTPRLTGGSALTVRWAERHGRPCLHLTPATPGAARQLRDFVAGHAIAVLNVAGPRASEEPEAGAFARQVLEAAFATDG